MLCKTLAVSKTLAVGKSIAALALTAAFALPTQAQEVIKLTLATGVPAVSLTNVELSNTFTAALNDELAKRGNKFKVEWTIGHAGTILKLPALFQGASDGVADMVVMTQAFEQAKLPLQNVAFVAPFNGADHRQAMKAFDDTNNAIPAMRDAFDKNNTVYLGALGFDYYILQSKQNIKSFEDLKGRKVGGIGPNLSWVRVAGATGVQASLATVYNDMQSGIFDAMITTPTASGSIKLQEVAPFILDAGLGAHPVTLAVFNKSRWQKLPKDVQDAVRVAFERFRESYFKRLDDGIKTSIDGMTKGGGTFISMSAAERQRWAQALPPLGLDWAKDMEAKRQPGREVLTRYLENLRKNGAQPSRAWDKE